MSQITLKKLALKIQKKVKVNWVEPDTSPGPGLGGAEWITCFHCGRQKERSDPKPFPHKKDCLVYMVDQLVGWLD